MADYDELYAHLDIVFFNDTKLHKRLTAEAREKDRAAAEVWVDEERVSIKFPGMKDSLVAPAHAQCAQAQLSDGTRGGFITYAEKFHKHYDHWKAHGGEQLVMGTPIAEAKFVTKGQIESLKSLKILSIEQLASVDEGAMKRIGPHAQAIVEQAQDFVASKADNSALVSEMDELKRQIAELKGEKAEPVVSTAAAETAPEGDDFDGMDKKALRDYINSKSGHAVKGQPSEDTLRRMARDVSQEVAA